MFLPTLVGCTLAAMARGQGTSEFTLANLEGTLHFHLELRDGRPRYSLTWTGGSEREVVVQGSALGITRTDADFTKDLRLEKVSRPKVVRERYRLLSGKFAEVKSQSVEQSFSFSNALGIPMTLTVRMFGSGMAFRYGFPGRSSTLYRVQKESTEFAIPQNSRIWSQPYSKVDVWAPAYESEYVNGIPAGTRAPGPEGWSFPLVFTTGKVWALVTESDLEPTAFASHLEPDAEAGRYRVRPPEEPETYGVAPTEAAITLPWQSPWRVVIVGNRAGDLIESTLVTDLAKPSEISDTRWIRSGLASWSWWSDMSSPYSYEKLVPFVDAAAQHGWPFSLVDLGWDTMQGGDIKKLVRYAKAKGVRLFVWYNSGGKHNQVPDAGPRDRMTDPTVRNQEMARISQLGIAGIKVDFMQSDKQYVVGLYHDILRDAAKHHLLVNFHGATLPRGWERTYPHLMSMEGVRGAEQYWEKRFADYVHTLATIYAFTRNAVGPMDFTPTVFTDPGATNPQLQPHRTTWAFELALLVVFQSGIQHVIDPASSLMTLPEYMNEHLHSLPATWDETRVVSGEPGDYVVIARRRGTRWYLGGINGRDEAREVSVPLSFLGSGKYRLSLIADGDRPNHPSHQTSSATGATVLKIKMSGRGGFSGRLQPASM